MPKFAICLCLYLVGVTGAFAQSDVAGRYRLEGRNPSGSGSYRGEVVVERNGDAYRVLWQIGPTRQVGTGIVLDKVLSLTFQAGAGPAGVAAFRINPDGSLTGIWAASGAPAVGTETWTPADRS
jgi:hypothetical protein